jgi:putative transposase
MPWLYYPITYIAFGHYRKMIVITQNAGRWTLIKIYFSKQLPKTERITTSRVKKGERGVWQRRFWEHVIRDERDYLNHIEYIHINPIKHDYVENTKDWPYSSLYKIQKAAAEGIIP